MAHWINEADFESHIERHLLERENYRTLPPDTYSKELCIIPSELIAFIKETQIEKYNALTEQYGNNVERRILEFTANNIRAYGTVDILRENITDRGQKINLVYFKPAHGKTPEHSAWYGANRFSIIRQLKYSRQNENRIDLVLFVNGIPIITAELKNALTGQYLVEAEKQYQKSRDSKEPLLEFKRCLVHFAVSTEKVSMTTRLSGEKTRFLPFNKELVNPEIKDDFSTAYLWQDIWSRDSLLDLIQNYVNLQINKEKYFDSVSGKIKERSSTSLIFPRFHQRRAVIRLLKSVQEDGVGTNYLIYHSAGSGKSNTISWLSHRLSGFYQTKDSSKSLFDSVIVVTDRRVLDKQIQDNIHQFEQVPGVVVCIDEKMSAQDLKAAIEKNRKIIVTTLQKFPIISDTIGHFPDRRYAVIIDEAHSSQSGEAARHLKKSLSLEEAEQLDEAEKTTDEIVLEEISKKGRQKNISYFAFTATPKDKTLELFGTMIDGELKPFDTYTMEQAIKEGFILDVLKNYISFRRYYKLIQKVEERDSEYEKKKTVRLLSSYVDLQDHAIEKKTKVILDHFISQTQNQIQGRAKAMLVTRSRLHAVRFKRKFDEVMKEMKLPYSALVAFSGSVFDGDTGADYTEIGMNNLGGKLSIVDAFKIPSYRILIVANKFQTGFDEPLLHTMIVDKKLGGVSTVQTLSRLNRTIAGKDSTMVLDFVNDTELVLKDFQEYYGSIYMMEENQTDPNLLYLDLDKLKEFHIYGVNDIQEYADIFFQKGDEMERLQPILNRCSEIFQSTLNENQQYEFRSAIQSFVRLYRFLSQIITFSDVELEKSYVFLSGLLKKLPATTHRLPYEVLDEIRLESYKLQHQFTTSLIMEPTITEKYGMNKENAKGPEEDELDFLSNIIHLLNETYGLELSENDKVEFEQMQKNLYKNENLMSFFNPNNTKDNIQDKFYSEIDNELLNFINTKLELYNKLTDDRVNLMFKALWFNEIYDQKVRGLMR